ncbi:MAG: sigma-70 family RNA polymerase sigma factor [Bacteroidetes bacterium]|nr:MAG: sigma-70 family RNA polymerase sigma factor [Bacteroidota bacterium]
MEYPMLYSDIDYINAIKAQDDTILEHLYKQYFRMVRHYVITNNGNESDAKDIYHETLMAVIHLIRKDGFILQSSLSTLIYAISKRLWLKHLNKNKNILFSEKIHSQEDTSPINNIIDELIEEQQQKEHHLLKMQTALQSIGNPCYEILKEFYYNKLNMEQIAQKLGYNNADVAKNQKYKCLQRLKKYFFEQKHDYNPLKTSDYES